MALSALDSSTYEMVALVNSSATCVGAKKGNRGPGRGNWSAEGLSSQLPYMHNQTRPPGTYRFGCSLQRTCQAMPSQTE